MGAGKMVYDGRRWCLVAPWWGCELRRATRAKIQGGVPEIVDDVSTTVDFATGDAEATVVDVLAAARGVAYR